MVRISEVVLVRCEEVSESFDSVRFSDIKAVNTFLACRAKSIKDTDREKYHFTVHWADGWEWNHCYSLNRFAESPSLGWQMVGRLRSLARKGPDANKYKRLLFQRDFQVEQDEPDNNGQVAIIEAVLASFGLKMASPDDPIYQGRSSVSFQNNLPDDSANESGEGGD